MQLDELSRSAAELGFIACVLLDAEATLFIAAVVAKFQPEKLTGHLAIRRHAVAMPLEPHEFTLSRCLPQEAAYVLFDQAGQDRGRVIVLESGQAVCSVLENAFGMEYFVSDADHDYLIAVNWYVIEAAGAAAGWLDGCVPRWRD
jgi:hypothetical protein